MRNRGRFSAARRTIFIAISALLLVLSGCNGTSEEATKAAIKACTDHGGAPTLGRWGEVTDCKFPPEKGAAAK